MTQPDRVEKIHRPLPETIHPDIFKKAIGLVICIESNDRLLNPNLGRRLDWRQRIVDGDKVTIEGAWRGSQDPEPVFRVSGRHGFDSDQTIVDFPNPMDPVVARTINDILVESTRKRVVTDFP